MAAYFQEIFNVEVQHDFYASRLCNDLQFHVPEETQRAMDLYHLKAMPGKGQIANQVKVMMQGEMVATQFTPKSPPSENFSLFFLLSQHNDQLPNFTVLPDFAPNEALLLYNRNSLNSASNLLFDNAKRDVVTGKLNHDTVFIYGKVFTHAFSGTADSTLTVTLNRNGEVVQTHSVSSPTTDYSVSINASSLSSGRYTLDTGSETIELCLFDKLPEKPTFALVEIQHSLEDGSEKPFQYDGPTAYKMAMERDERPWRYYIISKQNLPSLVVAPFTSAPSPYPAAISFPIVSAPDAEETATIARLGAIYGSSTPILLFKSDVDLPFFETKLKGIKLMDSSTLVMENLPNPSIGSGKTEEVVCIAPSSIFPIDPGSDSADDYGKLPAKKEINPDEPEEPLISISK